MCYYFPLILEFKKSSIDCIMPSFYNMKGKKETPTIIIVISN